MGAMHSDDTPREPFAGLAQRWIARFRDESEATRLLRALGGDHRHPAMAEAASRVNDGFVDFLVRLASATGGRAPAGGGNTHEGARDADRRGA